MLSAGIVILSIMIQGDKDAHTLGQDVRELIHQQQNHYTLAPFAPLLEQILAHFGSLDCLKDKNVLELGPGSRMDLLRFLHDQIGVRAIRGVGRSVTLPWTQHRRFQCEICQNIRFMDFFSSLSESLYDLIYSRFVFEQHSIDPLILLSSRAYWNQFKKKRFSDFDETYPASIPNLQTVFRMLWQTLRPGGLFLALIGKRKYSALDRDFLASFQTQAVSILNRGSLSQVVVVKK